MRAAFTLVELLVVIAIIGILVALLLPAIQAAREAARRTQCQTNLHNLALGMLNYHDSQKSFPYALVNPANPTTGVSLNNNLQGFTGNNPLLVANWAIQILPYVEEQPLYDSFVLYDEPIPGGTGTGARLNDGVNRTQRGTEIQYMLCPSDSGREQKFGDGLPPLNGGNWARGNYGYNAGLGYVGNMMSVGTTDDPWPLQCGRGVGGYNRGAKMSQIEDGTTKTLMLGEIRIGLSASDRRGVWAMGMVGSNVLAEQASNFALGPNDCGDGTDDLAITDAAVNEIGEDNYLVECMNPSEYRQSVSSVIRSKHPGGVHAALCDGSVRFITDDIQSGIGSAGYKNACELGTMNDFGVWQRLNSSNDSYILGESGF